MILDLGHVPGLSSMKLQMPIRRGMEQFFRINVPISVSTGLSSFALSKNRKCSVNCHVDRNKSTGRRKSNKLFFCCFRFYLFFHFL